jgi:hypothetical protein
MGVQGQSVSGGYTLRGVDTVSVSIANGCIGWRLEGTERGMDCP